MEVVILPTAIDVGELAADVVVRHLQSSARPVVGLATGSTPLPLYRELLSRSTNGLPVDAATLFLLDEYVGLPADHPSSYRRFIGEQLTDGLGVAPRSLHGPDGCAPDLPAEAARYEAAIAAAGGIDVQILGLGSDGHIGFNEPGSSLASRTRIKTLTEQTRRDNARFFADGEVPLHVITQGIGTILDARHLLLLVTGAHKAGAAARALEEPVTTMVPGSAVQLHPHVTVLMDEPAATQLTLADYHRATWSAKPPWQRL